MKTLRILALAAVVGIVVCVAAYEALSHVQAAQAHQATLAASLDALHYAEQQQSLDQQPYNIKAASELCNDTHDECARQAFIKASDDRFAITRARIDCTNAGGTPDECN